MSAADAPAADRQGVFVKWFALALLGYWGLYALLAPVTIYDSHVYNLARLLIIRQGGFFGNHVWNASEQISYPWGFDALHYPFLGLGAGFDLPSFACFVGTLMVVYQLVRPRYGAPAAWWCLLTLLAMPTLVYQATSTKNDMAGVFGVAAWLLALCRWRQRRERAYLFLMALALAFDAGTKLSGPPVAAALALYTGWELRAAPRRRLCDFAGALAIGLLLFGSAETYLNNWLLFKSPLGPPDAIRFHRNVDGLAGGAANFVRYGFGTMSVGVDAANPRSPVPGWLENAGRATLHFLGLNDVGYRRDYNDARFSVLKLGLEAASDFGPVGALALLTALCLAVGRAPRDPLWKLSAAGLAALAQTCLMVGWMPWNNRFLLLPFTLFGVAFTLFALREGPWARPRRTLLLLLLGFSAVVYPLCSYNRKPADLLAAVTRREALALSERATMGEIVRDLRARVRAGGVPPLLMTASTAAWTYDVLNIRGLKVLPAPNLTRETLLATQARTRAPRLLVLTLDRPLDPALAADLHPLNVYEESNTVLYAWQRAGGAEPPAGPDLVTHFAEGWFAEEGPPAERFRWMSAAGQLKVVSGRGGTLVLSARLRSFVPDNAVELTVDGQPVAAAVPLPDADWKDVLLRVPLPAGIHQVALRSRQLGRQPPGDNRALTVCVANFRAALETAADK